MNNTKFLIYIDILGFDALASQIGNLKGIKTKEVRNRFIDVIKERVAVIENEGKIIGKNWGKRDDWLLVTNSLNNVYRSIAEILEHETPYEGYERIPLEIALGVAKYDKWAKFNGENLIIEDETIKFLKTDIVGYYHKWYKDQHSEPIKSTFVILTEAFFHALEPFDRKFCSEIKYDKGSKKKGKISFYYSDANRVKRRGKIFHFLEKIGHMESKWYGRIDDIYVPPTEYEEINNTLKDKRIVFITGTQEYGKTYTAVRLMWEYFTNGFEPKWIRGGELTERIDVRKKLENIEEELRPYHIIYFEDPFGKIKYEKRESLERIIGTIVETVSRVANTYVVITSREEVFKEFEKEKISEKNIREFESNLNIKKPSYNTEKRTEIILKWAEEENCIWLGNKHLRNMILYYIEEENLLPTPLSIKTFLKATVNIKSLEKLIDELRIKSMESAKAFADEIKNMSHDKVLFLLFVFSNNSEIDFMKNIFEEIVNEIKMDYAWEFDRILNWFKNDKINIVTYYPGKHLEFSHPSYSNALSHLLIEDGHITEINRTLFCKLLSKLSDADKAPEQTAVAILDNFNILPKNVRDELILKLGKNGKTAWRIARQIVFSLINKKEISEDWLKLLFKLCEIEKAAVHISRQVAMNFKSIPDSLKVDILLKLSENRKAVKGVTRAITENYKEKPEGLRNLLFVLGERNESAGYVAAAIIRNFGDLPNDVRELLIQISKKSEAIEDLSRALLDNFEQIPEDLRTRLLYRLSENKNGAGQVAIILFKYFNELDNNVRNNLLAKVSNKETAIGPIVRTIVVYYKKLPEQLRILLSEFIEKGNSIKTISRAIINYFECLPESVGTSLLLKLSEKEDAGKIVVIALVRMFNKLPQSIRHQLLVKLSKMSTSAEHAKIFIRENYKKLPKYVQKCIG